MLTIKKKYYRITGAVNERKLSHRFQGLNDLHTYFIIPLLGIAVPSITGLINPANFSLPSLLIQYTLFIGIALIIYKGNMFFLHSIKLRLNGTNMPYRKIVAIYFMVNIVYSGIISLASLSAWDSLVNNDAPFAKPVITTTLVILICVLFINNLYEIFYLQAEKEDSYEKMVLLEQAKLQAELQALNSEIDPHFMYNALTSLSYLLQQNPSQADNFNAMLATQYRYVLKNKCLPFVPLHQEIEFCRQYFTIQQLRFNNTVLLQVIQGNNDLHTLKVPPLSVQTLVENALKHNSFSDDKPLLVQVYITDKYVQVLNKIQKHTHPAQGTGTGLHNLNQRIKLLSKEPLVVERSSEQFSVKLPVLPL